MMQLARGVHASTRGSVAFGAPFLRAHTLTLSLGGRTWAVGARLRLGGQRTGEVPVQAFGVFFLHPPFPRAKERRWPVASRGVGTPASSATARTADHACAHYAPACVRPRGIYETFALRSRERATIAMLDAWSAAAQLG